MASSFQFYHLYASEIAEHDWFQKHNKTVGLKYNLFLNLV